ncbi:MAG: hypothetical protein SFZ23_09960 [Planctomycetota bacterium]|nr:hypothetical protein [Planctomycetota bacterium]
MKVAMIGAAALAALAGSAFGQVQHGTLNVVENDGGNTAASVTVTRAGGDGVWAVEAAANSRGDYGLDFFTGNDQANGILITGVAQLGRTEPSFAVPEYYATSSSARQTTGTFLNKYFIAIHDAPGGSEVNYNPNFAYFPAANGWLGGVAYNSVNNGPITSLVAAPASLQIVTSITGVGNEFFDDPATAGAYVLSAQGIDFRRDGIVLVSGARNEDNRGRVFVNFDGRAVLSSVDNGGEGGLNSGENDDVGFVFIPENTPGVTYANFTGSGKIVNKQGNISVEMVGQPTTNGTFRITIAGESASTGTLIAVPHTEPDGTTVDNPVFIQADGDGWILTTRDTEPYPPTGTGLVLQDLAAYDIIAHVAFFKNGVNIQPGTPTRAYADRLDDVVAARFAVTEFTPDNGNGDMRTERAAGSDALAAVGDNRGDNGLAWLNARPAARTNNGLDSLEGVFIPVATEFIRDNSATGGISGWSTVSFDNGEVRSHNASPAGGEINSNFGVAFFPAVRGFNQAAEQVADNGLATVDVGVPALDSGVLIPTNWNNDNRIYTSTPNSTGFDLAIFSGATGLPDGAAAEYGYIYLPYTTPGIIAGHIAADGTVLSSAGTFTIGAGTDTLGFPVTTIAIPGVNAATDGILLLVGTDASNPSAMAFEAGAAGEFEVAGLNLLTGVPGQVAFQFVYIPYEGFGIGGGNPCERPDFNDDGQVDFFDYLDFANAFAAEEPAADYNGDTQVDFFDYLDFAADFGQCS